MSAVPGRIASATARVESKLRMADAQRMRVYYQPQVRQSEDIAGMEALIRWSIRSWA